MSDTPAAPPVAPPVASPVARTTIFADAITDVVVANGVARLTLAMTGPDNKPAAVATLCVPVMQLPAMAKGFGNLVQQLQEKVQEQVRAAQQQPQRAAQPAAIDGAIAADSAFRFKS